MPTNKIEPAIRPQPSPAYVQLLKQEPPQECAEPIKAWFREYRDKLQKEFSKHEWDWQGYGDKMELRAGYK